MQGQIPHCVAGLIMGHHEKRGRARAAGQQVSTAGARARRAIKRTCVGGHDVGAQVRPQGKLQRAGHSTSEAVTKGVEA